MSTHMVGKVDIDALVTVAMRFTAAQPLPLGPSSPVPPRITESNADEVGRTLWVENWRLNWDLHPDFWDADEWDDRRWEEFDPQTANPPAEIDGYTFMELFGDPLAGTAGRIVAYYRYQTAGQLWSEGSYGRQFSDALDALISGGPVADRGYYEGLPGGDRAYVPWGLKESDRDLFLRSAGNV